MCRSLLLVTLCAIGAWAHAADFEQLTAQRIEADQLAKAGRYEEALAKYQQLLPGFVEFYGAADHPMVARLEGHLTQMHYKLGNHGEAERLLLRIIAVYRSKLSPRRPDLAITLYSLGSLYRELGQYAKAGQLLDESLRLLETHQGHDDIDTAVCLHNLAELRSDLKDYRQALALAERSLRIKESKADADPLDAAMTRNLLGGIHLELHDFAKAVRYYEQTLQARERHLAAGHPDIAIARNNLGVARFSQGDSAAALQEFQRSLDSRKAMLGADHPDVATALANLACVHGSQGRWREAVDMQDQASRIRRQAAAAVLPYLAEPEQLRFLRSRVELDWFMPLSIGLEQASDTAIAARSAEWLLNAKGTALEALAERVVLSRDDAKATDQGKALTDIRAQLAALAYRGPVGQSAADHRRRLAELTEREEQLAKAMGRSSLRSSSVWIELKPIRQALATDAVFIDIARFQPRDFQRRGAAGVWLLARYVAWVVPSVDKGDVRVVDLGDAERIDVAVQAVQQALHEAPAKIRQSNEAEAEKQLRPALESLSRLVLQPLLKPCGNATRWIISPDGALWLTPWAALVTDGGYFIEKRQVRHVVSGRELMRKPADVMPRPPVMIADPDFDLDPAKAREESKRLVRDRDADARNMISAGTLAAAKRLPGTLEEARAIAPRLKFLADAEPEIYWNQQALEGVFKTVRHPRLAVLSTHAFFLNDAAGNAANWENPLLRCGLLFAGANRRQERQDTTGDDGVLTGLEITGVDLRGTELVVLSACDTGVGELRAAEGVAGLRQAFHLAGARAVLATLWPISDRQTVPLMTAFFEELAAGRDHAEALQKAQQSVLHTRRMNNQAAHPYYWAAFSLTGP